MSLIILTKNVEVGINIHKVSWEWTRDERARGETSDRGKEHKNTPHDCFKKSCYDATALSMWAYPWEYGIYGVKIIKQLVRDTCVIPD